MTGALLRRTTQVHEVWRGREEVRRRSHWRILRSVKENTLKHTAIHQLVVFVGRWRVGEREEQGKLEWIWGR